MGCDIHTYAERKVGDAYELIADLCPFDWRSYGMYGFLADVRNYSDVLALAADRGLPDDASEVVRLDRHRWGSDAHSASWVGVQELVDFNYDKPVEDRRVTVQLAENVWSGGRHGRARRRRDDHLSRVPGRSILR